MSPSVDANEAITTDPATALTYKYTSRDEIWKAGRDQYTYDVSGRRETAAGVSYLYNGHTPVWMSSGSGMNIAALPDSNEILNLNGVVPIHDALGTVLGGVNSSGTFAFQNTYDPFGGFTTSGSPPSGYGQVYGMAGIEYDSTSLYHAGPRYYSPVLQRFLSEDPVRGKANMYLYATNNPVTGSDISGLQGFCPNGDCASGAGGQENAPTDSTGLIGLVASIIQDILGAASGGNPAPNYQRSQNAMAFGRFNRTGGIDRANVYAQSGGIVEVQDEGDDAEEEEKAQEEEESEDEGIIAGVLGGLIDSTEEDAPGIVAKNGTRISGFTKHGVDRAIGDMAERAGTKPDAILDALKNPVRIQSGVNPKGPFEVFTGQNARVIVNPASGKIISVNPLSAAGAVK